jgi:hypothetical protein
LRPGRWLERLTSPRQWLDAADRPARLRQSLPQPGSPLAGVCYHYSAQPSIAEAGLAPASMPKFEGCTQEIAFRTPARTKRCAGESSTGCGKGGSSIGENLSFCPIAEGFLALTFQDQAVNAGNIDINCLWRGGLTRAASKPAARQKSDFLCAAFNLGHACRCKSCLGKGWLGRVVIADSGWGRPQLGQALP